MVKFKDRKPLDLDMDGRFEENSTGEHNRNACGSIGRLKEYGREFWGEGTNQLGRWEEGCNTLWQFINALGNHRHIENKNLESVLRVFFAEFEHTRFRLVQMVLGEVDDQDENPKFKEIYDWTVRVQWYCIYAIVSFWIDDKYDKTRIDIHMKGKAIQDSEGNFQGVKFETKEVCHPNPMKVPKKYQRGSEKLK